ncbi:hypothetical protein ES332_D05G134100v1 [Gossypium tomentosum]|uniref:Uncharacterized protein n=1 Tax=Gossypium tomentosum TaxID=34277 RepID=A0A5D2KVG6_GOSTO|nr:hypothetical protein ES332_D05G134100v1 [Gossypium tomentosum]
MTGGRRCAKETFQPRFFGVLKDPTFFGLKDQERAPLALLLGPIPTTGKGTPTTGLEGLFQARYPWPTMVAEGVQGGWRLGADLGAAHLGFFG